MAFFKVYKLGELPPSLEANSVYFVENPDDPENLDIYVTDKIGATARSALRKEIVENMINDAKEELIDLVSSTAVVIPASKQDDRIYPSFPTFYGPYVDIYGPLSPVVAESPVVSGVNSIFFPITFLNKIKVNQVVSHCSVYLDGTVVEDVASLQVKIREYTDTGVVGNVIAISDALTINTSDTDQSVEERIFTLPEDVELNGNYWVEIICNYADPINPNFIFYAMSDQGNQYTQYYLDYEEYTILRAGYIAATGATQIPDTNVNMDAFTALPDESMMTAGVIGIENQFFIYFKYEEA